MNRELWSAVAERSGDTAVYVRRVESPESRTPPLTRRGEKAAWRWRFPPHSTASRRFMAPIRAKSLEVVALP